jgi:hypothetical protein
MRKLIPPAQRIFLNRFSVRESLNYVPLVQDAVGLPRLHDLLANCPLNLPVLENSLRDPPKSLRDFLLSAAEVNGTVTDDDVARSHYAAISILHAPPRRIADWWLTLQRLVERFARILQESRLYDRGKKVQVHRAIVNAVTDICQNAIREDRLLSSKTRGIYREALRINPAGIWKLTEPINAIPEIDRAYTVLGLRTPSGNHPWDTVHPAPRVFVNHGRGWYLQPAKARILFPPLSWIWNRYQTMNSTAGLLSRDSTQTAPMRSSCSTIYWVSAPTGRS